MTADVAIVGGGLAGLVCAVELAENGVNVALLDAGPLGGGATGSAPGLLLTGLAEQPWRLVHALGLERTRQFLQLSMANHQWLRGRIDGLEVEGLPWVALDEREPPELTQSAEVMAQMGLPCSLTDAAQTAARTGLTDPGPALWFDADGRIDPEAAVAALAALATASGATLHPDTAVTGRSDVDGAHRLHLATGADLVADVVIWCANAHLPRLHTAFADTVFPVREHAIDTAPFDGTITGGRAAYGYTSWARRPDGGLTLSGCRWATPHMEVGETDPGHTPDKITAALERTLNRLAPQAAAAGIVGRRAWIAGRSCDGLPIVGALPGDVTQLVCAAFQSNQWGLGAALASGVAKGLLTGNDGLPEWLSPRRFLTL